MKEENQPQTVADFARANGMSRTTIWRYTKLGLRILYVGKKRFIRPIDWNTFLESQPKMMADTHHGHPDKLTIRDKFAIAALQGLLSTAQFPDPIDANHFPKMLADTAYEYADAMMLARRPDAPTPH